MRVQTEVYINKRKNNWFLPIVIIAVLLWGTVFAVDYYRTMKQYELPIFMVLDTTTAAKDGGSGLYKGLGYTADISGNFLDDDAEPYGVTEGVFKLFTFELDRVEKIIE